jgi:hexosaminidase
MLTLFLSLLVSTVVGVWPEPGHFEQQQDPLRVSANFTIQLEPETAPRTIAADLAEAIATTISQIQRDSLAPLTAVPTGALYTKLETKKPSQQLRLLSIHLLQEHAHQNTLCPDQQQQPIYAKEHFLCHHPFTNSNYLQTSDHEHSIHNKPSIVAEMQLPLKERVEAYEIHIQSTDGHPTAVLSASSALGVLRGLQTFTQLVYTLKPTHKKTASSQDKAAQPDPLQQSIRFIHGPVHIKDQPAFPYRGLLLDTSRNFYSIASIQHTLRAMSWVKLNVLHWHIVDSQSWPIHIPSHPQLSQMGAYSDEETYSVQEIMDLTRFANSHGIEILLEIDSPGHTAIIGEAFPDLVACKNKAPWSNYAAEPRPLFCTLSLRLTHIFSDLLFVAPQLPANFASLTIAHSR